MRVVIPGGAGFIGRALAQRLLEDEHQVVVLTRDAERARRTMPPDALVDHWDGTSQGFWISHIDAADAVVNLTGESLAARRWTTRQKAVLVQSRVESTRAVVQALQNVDHKPAVLVNCSAVGYYGDVPEGDVTEISQIGTGFLAEMCGLWEHEAAKAESSGVRVVLPRISTVLGRGGGALPKLTLPFRFHVGSYIGSGRQWFPWIHIDDLTALVLFLLHQESMAGPVNAVSPESVTMAGFGATLGSVLGRRSWFPVPAFPLRILVGEMADALLGGAKVVPRKLQEAGFEFRFPQLRSALTDILR